MVIHLDNSLVKKNVAETEITLTSYLSICRRRLEDPGASLDDHSSSSISSISTTRAE